MISGDKGEAPDAIKRTRPPSFSFILLKTNLSHIGDGFLPEINVNNTLPTSENNNALQQQHKFSSSLFQYQV